MSERGTHMAREIAEIPQAAARFLDQSGPAVRKAASVLRRSDPRLMLTVARGSSDHVATYLKYLVELSAAIPVATAAPSIASIYHRTLRLDGAFCIGISQSGQSPDIVEMMESARRGGGVTLAITNSVEAPLADACEWVLPLLAGPERSIAATKTYVISVMAALALVAEWQEDETLRRAVARLPDQFTDALRLDWSPLADRLAGANSLYVLGRGPGYAIANEMALKFKETCALHAESYSAAEVLHGPAALVQDRFPVLALALEDGARGQVMATAERLAGQGADVFVTAPDPAPPITALPTLAHLHPRTAPLLLIVTFYRFVEALARRRGLNPDEPPHLRKITITQ
jgi:glutamine---fructose-6-phosphate transaminase (isomerizing)